MIYTLTLNPSIDYLIYPEKELEKGALNRFDRHAKFAGGKGINISRMLKRMSVPSVALGYSGGFSGEFIQSQLDESEIENLFIQVEEDSRINVKIKGEKETEINGLGPYISQKKQDELIKYVSKLTQDDIMILSGSKPPSLPEDFYETLIGVLKEKNVSFVIDTTGEELINALPYQPLLIKPNKEELEDMYETTLSDDRAVIRCGEDLLSRGAEHVIISMGAEGAFLITREGVYHGYAEPGTLVNSVGAGDAMVAGFVGKFLDIGDAVLAFKYSLACGSATAYSEDLASSAAVDDLISTVSVIKLID